MLMYEHEYLSQSMPCSIMVSNFHTQMFFKLCSVCLFVVFGKLELFVLSRKFNYKVAYI